MMAQRYADFRERIKGKRVLYLELSVGGNTPVIIKFPFWNAVAENENATYASVNMGEACTLAAIENQSILVDGDIRELLDRTR